MNKNVIIGIVVLVVAVLAWWLFASKPATAPTTETLPAAGEFTQELSGLDQVDLEADLQSLDADLKAL